MTVSAQSSKTIRPHPCHHSLIQGSTRRPIRESRAAAIVYTANRKQYLCVGSLFPPVAAHLTRFLVAGRQWRITLDCVSTLVSQTDMGSLGKHATCKTTLINNFVLMRTILMAWALRTALHWMVIECE